MHQQRHLSNYYQQQYSSYSLQHKHQMVNANVPGKYSAAQNQFTSSHAHFYQQAQNSQFYSSAPVQNQGFVHQTGYSSYSDIHNGS